MITYPRVDYHIHSRLSACGSSFSTTKSIIRAAERRKFEAIAITDHLDFPEDLKRSETVREELTKLRPNIKVMVGCEMEGSMTSLPLTQTEVEHLDLIIVSTTHVGSLPPGYEPGSSIETRVAAFEKALDKAVSFAFPDIVAHPLIFFERYPGLEEMFQIVGTDRLKEIMKKAVDNSMAFELSPRAYSSGPVQCIADFYRMFLDCGGKISLGSDAHDPAAVCSLGLTSSILRLADIPPSNILIV